MKVALFIVAVLIFLAGLTFFLQGINILPGSYMTGSSGWAVTGAIMMIVTGGLVWFANRKR